MLLGVSDIKNTHYGRRLTHEATEAGEGSGDACLWVYLDEGVPLCVDVHLKKASPVQWAVHQH